MAPLLVTAAVATDVLDGQLARRARCPSRGGELLDTVADVAFVLPVLAWGAVRGLIPAAAPLAVASAAAAYALASARASIAASRLVLAPSRTGRAAGVANYVLAAALSALPAIAAEGCAAALLAPLGWGVAAFNAAAVAARLLPRRKPRP